MFAGENVYLATEQPCVLQVGLGQSQTLWSDPVGSLPRLRLSNPGTPPPDWPREPSASAEVWHDREGALCAWGEKRNGLLRVHFPRHAVFAFRLPLSEVEVFVDPHVGSGAVTDTYLRTVLPLALQAEGLEVLHASAVKTDQGILGICGLSGSGKSTLAYGMSRRGFEHWADDAVVVRASAPPSAVQLPCAIRLRPSAYGHFFAGGSPDDERVQFPFTPRGDRGAEPLRRVLVLDPREDAPSTPVASTLDPVDAFSSLLTHAYCFSLRDGPRKQRMLQQYMELASSVVTKRILYRQEPELLSSLLDYLERLLAA